VSAKRVLGDFRIFKATELTSLGPHGKEGRFVVLDPPDWAVVIPVIIRDGERRILAVRQFRHGIGEALTEFPGGVVEPGENPAVAAERELLEETGYQAGRIVHLGTCSPNPAFMSNAYHVFAALDPVLVAGQSLDEHEIVDVEEYSEAGMLAGMGEPPWTHALMMTAAWYYRRWRDREN
jgi:8-oxo-dGTP pyrophosphatase MutT (NUDIX family)